ncbi:MAG TPA: PAS domain-containing sensor histidine kinase [Polyangiaceae bacterium]|nr:PAS domain-containing sensor histidine kinase [Polyangiaceae bacterium]
MSASPAELERRLRALELHRLELESQNAELRGAGKGLAAELERFIELFDFAPIAAVELAVDGRVRELNQAASQLLGAARSQLSGRHFRSFVAPSDRDRFDGFVEAQQVSRASRTLELTLLRAGKARFDARLVATRMGRSRGSIQVAFEDISERKARDGALARAQQALRDADRRKDEFLALLSHELRNPLTPLANCLYVLSRCDADSERALAARSIMQRQVEQLARLTEDLLDVTRIARGKMRLARQQIDLRELLEHTLEDHRASFEACGVSLDSQLHDMSSRNDEVAAGRCWVMADPARLTQTLSNLLGNARKFTPRGGRVVVSLRCEGARVALRVKDTGAGIAPEMLPWVFEPFAQAPQTLDRSQGGLGLGLAMVKGLVELHGGTVRVASDGPGLGTELCVWLPLDATRGEPASGDHASDAHDASSERALSA